MDTEQDHNPAAESSTKSTGRFRFKKSKSSSRSSRHDSDHHESRSRSHRHKHRSRHDDDDDIDRHSHRRHRKRRKRSTRSPSPKDPDPLSHGPPLSPNTAFRESLFDALGDDEGAAFWESVYGQPIHSFADPPGRNGTGGGDDNDGIQQMDEEEYAAYVRAEMWKRTREGMLEEQERIRAEKKAKARAEKTADAEEEKRRFERAMEDSLRRGRERKKTKEAWREAWTSYSGSWDEIESMRGKDEGERKSLRNLLFWPVESGKRRDITREGVEEFMRRAPPPSGAGSTVGSKDVLLSALKAERIRWHPDKIQHRYGALGLDDTTMRSVTEVFQIIDTMWNESK